MEQNAYIFLSQIKALLFNPPFLMVLCFPQLQDLLEVWDSTLVHHDRGEERMDVELANG